MSHFDKSLDTVLFCNSGSEATDLALRLATYYTERTDFICLEQAYHGHVQTALDVSPYKWKENGLVQKPDHVHVADSPDTFRFVSFQRLKLNFAGVNIRTKWPRTNMQMKSK